VLIDSRRDNVCMFGYIVIAFILLVGPLAVFYGADSRTDETASRDHRSA
jgi:hypothetical protein